MSVSRRLIVPVCLVWFGLINTSGAFATLTLTLTTPSGIDSAHPAPTDMARGGQINVSGGISWGYLDPYVTSVQLDVQGSNLERFYFGDATNFNPTTYAFSQMVTIPNGATPGACRTTAVGYTSQRPNPADTAWFSVAPAQSSGG